MKHQIKSVNEVKNHNTLLILNALKKMPFGTKSEVAAETGLSIATCNTILNELTRSNRVFETAGDAPASGRPPKLYEYNANCAHVCCVYLTHENFHKLFHFAFVNLLGEIIERGELEFEYIDGNTVVNTLEELISRDPLISKISIGFSGYLMEGKITSSGIPELWGFPIKKVVSEHFQMETHCNNDMNLITYGLFHSISPHSRDPFCAIALFKGRCPRGGCIVDGEIVKGFSNYAGEVLHLNASSEPFWSDISKHYDEAVKKSALIVSSYITVVNPRMIVMTGLNASGNMVQDIITECKKEILPEHIPDIIYIEDVSNYYIKGLFERTHETL